ncbi:MAG: PAS domain-containing protein, partial [Desulfosarcinaceae bacterium]
MPAETASFINIALISGGTLCHEILEMTETAFLEEDVNARIVAVVDPDPGQPGLALARERGLTTVADYHRLYDAAHNIQLFILLDPSAKMLDDILATKPAGLRVLSYAAFNLFWQAFKSKERKLQQRTLEIETVLNGIEDFFLVISPDQRIIEANEAFLRHMGYERDQVIGKRCYE